MEEILAAAKLCREEGFLANIDMIYGLPEETAADLDLSLKLTKQLAADGARIHAHVFIPLPGTPLRNAERTRRAATIRTALSDLTRQGCVYGQWERQLHPAIGHQA